ncbi:MAG TPA: hypothetical protein VLR46_09670 [Candidatus Dormibacteraeota bacterium]|nr:hypothetical protein [Candidatus Dormibacteraeota bacterium]
MTSQQAGLYGGLATLVVAAVAFGLAGLRWRGVRVLLMWVGPIYSLSIFVYYFFEGAGSQCAGSGPTFHCWEISYASTWGLYGSLFVGITVILSIAPVVSAVLRTRTPAVISAVVLPVLIGLYLSGLWTWAPAAAAVAAAAIAGPPSRGSNRAPAEARPAQ